MRNFLISSSTFICLACFIVPFAIAQDYNLPLTMQGLNHTAEPSAVSRAMGSTTIALKKDVGVMFSNPAALQTLEGIQISIGGLQQYKSNEQIQQWYANQWYTNFSLLMEGLTSGIVIDTVRVTGTPNAGDTIPKPYDNISPIWKNKKNQILPIQAMVAVPFTIKDINFTAGAGAIEYANLNYFYQNNNTLSPDIQYMTRPALSTDSRPTKFVNWSQSQRYRDGSIFGYGGALSASVLKELSLGVSALYLKGSTNDYEYIQGRGRLGFANTYFRLSPAPYIQKSTGTSDFKGYETTLSGTYTSKNFVFGFAVKPAASLTRDYKSTVVKDTAGVSTTWEVNGSDKMKLPFRWTIGLGIILRENVSVSIEYQNNPMSAAEFITKDTTTKPWLDGSAVRVGMEYLPVPWLALRGGYQILSEVFQSQAYGLKNDAVTYSVYSVGAGAQILPNLRLNIAYEYINLKYEDAWSTNANANTEMRYNIVAGISYDLSFE